MYAILVFSILFYSILFYSILLYSTVLSISLPAAPLPLFTFGRSSSPPFSNRSRTVCIARCTAVCEADAAAGMNMGSSVKPSPASETVSFKRN